MSQQTFIDIITCIKLGIKLGNAVCYPFVKISKHRKLIAGDIDKGLERMVKDDPGFSGQAAQILKEFPPISSPGLLKFSNKIAIVTKILDALDRAFVYYAITEYLAKMDDGNFFGLKTNKTLFGIIKWTFFGVATMLVIAYIVDLCFENILSERVRKIVNTIKAVLSDLYRVALAVYAAYALFNLLINQFSDKVDSKNKGLNKQNIGTFINCVVALLGLSDVSLIEKSLAKNPKVYYGLVGVSTIAKLASVTALVLTKNTPLWTSNFVSIGKEKFEPVLVEKNTLFLYFCGTRETTAIHTDQFMNDIIAKNQIYVSGIGAVQSIYKKSSDADLEVTGELIGATSQKYHFEHENRSVTCIEKFYAGDDLGYRAKDSRQVAEYSYDAFKDVLHADPKINKIIIAGHSRGAAVGLPSFLYKLLDAPRELIERLKRCQIFVFPLDPVAGQTSNGYHMGDDWTTQDLYGKLLKTFGTDISIAEVWARAAKMLPVADFHPAKRFLQNPADQSMKLFRLSLGYEHSAMVNAKKNYHHYYTMLYLESPYRLLVKLVNEFINSLSINDSKIAEIIQKHRADFDKNDKAVAAAKKIDYSKGERTAYNDMTGKEVNFEDFIKSYRKLPK